MNHNELEHSGAGALHKLLCLIKKVDCTLTNQINARAEVSTLKNAKLCKIGVECVEFM